MNPQLKDIVTMQSDTGYVFLDLNEDLAHCEYEWLKAPPELFMAYGYARRTIAGALLIQGVVNRDVYSQAVSTFKHIQIKTNHTVDFQEAAAHAAMVFMSGYDSRINRTTTGLIVGLANAFKPFAAPAPMDDESLFSALVYRSEA